MDEISVQLSKRIVVNGEDTDILIFRPLTMKNFKDAKKIKDPTDQMDFFIKQSAGMLDPDFDRIDLRDYPKLVEAVESFLPQFPEKATA